jgi:hypothetical protein
MIVLYSFLSFGIFSPFWYVWTKKNLATLLVSDTQWRTSLGRGIVWSLSQGCQMVCFQTKNPNLGKFWRALDWKMLIYFMTI